MESDRPVLNILWYTECIEHNGKIWGTHSFYINELSKHFDINLFCSVRPQGDIDPDIYCQFVDEITVFNLFNEINRKDYIKNHRKYMGFIKRECDLEEDIFLVNYPYMKVGMMMSYQLKDTNLVIRAISDWVGRFALEDEGVVTNVAKKSLKPAGSIIYPIITKRIFRDNLVIYAGESLYDIGNKNQHEFIYLMRINNNDEVVNYKYNRQVIFIGRENYQKGIDLAIKAVNNIDIDIKLNVLGMDDLTKFNHLDTRNVEFMGRVYDDEKFFNIVSKNDFLLMPSTAEKQGKVQFEAMSAGVVPICADSGGIPFTVDHNYNSLLFEERSLEDLIQSMKRGYSSPHLYRSLIDGGLETTDSLNPESQMKKFASIIKNHYIR
ncbi:glycosyltransferase [Natrialba sp. SSL1]|uniref:glycosyltransferase n=1 Tax=Natrialba sp. SSL1 TaxID=1869245 RepID=UPI000A00722C|nr:glycosyltransferase [Natrialba sp. SSL1]